MDNPVDEESRAKGAEEGYPRVSHQFSDTSESTEGEFEPKIGPSDGEKLLKASLERRAQNTTPVRSNAFQRDTIPDPDDAALDDRMANSSGPRMARMKKIRRNRRDRITVVQNPAAPSSPKHIPAPSSPSPSQKSGSASSTPRTSPSRRTQSSPVRQASPGGSMSSSQRSSSAGRHPSRERVAGGAAAKLIGPKTEDEDEEEEICSNQSASEAEADFNVDIDEYSHLTELDQVRRKARVEYDIGTEQNRRYKLNWDTFDSDDEDKDDLNSEATLPSILDRSEVFHENATAAIIALLNPKGKRHEPGSVVSVQSGMPLSPASIGPASSAVSPSRGVGSPTHNVVSGRLSTTSTKLIKTPTSTLSPENLEWQPHEVGAVSALDAPQIAKTKVPNQPLLTATAEQKLELMKKAMIDPSKTLAELLTAIATPPEGEEMDQAYMVRRKNACGALKVLTAKEANRRTIGWTLGVYPALASVLHDGGEGKLEDTFPDERIRNEYFEARNRAVSALLNLCLLKENRIPIFHCPGLLHGLAKTIMQDTTEARQGCTAVLGFLAKTPENRLLLVKVPGILDALNSAIKPWSPEGLEDSPERKTKKFVWDSTSGSYSMTTSPSQNFSTDKGTTDEDSATESSQSDADDVASELTPQMTTSPTSLSLASRRSFLYDNDPNKFVNGTRQNVFATLLHVVKEKDNAVSENVLLQREQRKLVHISSREMFLSLSFVSFILHDTLISCSLWLISPTCMKVPPTHMPSKSFVTLPDTVETQSFWCLTTAL